MLPYFDQPKLSLGPITIHAFGVLVALAVWVGFRVFNKRVQAAGLDPRLAERLFTWVIVGGFIGAHLVDRLIYHPQVTLADPMSLLRFWDGLSSFGGFLGAIVGAILFIRRAKLGPSTWQFVDGIAYASTHGWIFGRLGCFVAFDHPGAETTLFLGQVYRDGKVRHNLGLEEALFTIVLALIFHFLGREKRYPGFFLGLLFVLYAPVRFVMDFGRLIDVRYLALTPGQWGAIALFLFGLVVLTVAKRRAALADALLAPM